MCPSLPLSCQCIPQIFSLKVFFSESFSSRSRNLPHWRIQMCLSVCLYPHLCNVRNIRVAILQKSIRFFTLKSITHIIITIWYQSPHPQWDVHAGRSPKLLWWRYGLDWCAIIGCVNKFGAVGTLQGWSDVDFDRIGTLAHCEHPF